MNGSMLWVLVEKLENLNLRTSSALTCNLVPGSGRIIKNLSEPDIPQHTLHRGRKRRR